jgi:hypothetical protein
MKIPPFLRAHSVLDSIQKGHIVLSVAVDKEAILSLSSVCVSRRARARALLIVSGGQQPGAARIFYNFRFFHGPPGFHTEKDVKNRTMVPCIFRSAEKKCKAAEKPGVSHNICRPARRYLAPPA